MTYQSRGTIPCVRCGAADSIGRKLCRKCYNVVRNTGELEKYPLLGPKDVFESRIKKTSGCWLWGGTKNQYGYGIFLLPGEVPVRAHRYAYEHFVGRIPKGKIVLHKCDNPPCVNPDHLVIGTKMENILDSMSKGRRPRGNEHWNSKLDARSVAAIRRSKEPQVVLAKRYGVHQSTISFVKRRILWQ